MRQLQFVAAVHQFGSAAVRCRPDFAFFVGHSVALGWR
jgi:hypothetical protein